MLHLMFQLFTEGTALSCEVISSQQQVTVAQQINTETTTANSVSQVLKLGGEDPDDPEREPPGVSLRSFPGESQRS